MRFLCVIPARIGSTRLPQKPLCLLAGTPLIRLVAQRILDLGIGGRIVVAADDERVIDAVAGLPVDKVMTDPRHGSGTERVAEVAWRPEYAAYDIILNLQGDEPFCSGEAINGALARVAAGDPIGTAAGILAPADAGNPHRVKVRVDEAGYAIRFSRAAISHTGSPHGFLQHIGLYACRRQALFDWVHAQPVPEELTERLEQLRPLRLGMRIGVAVLDEAVLPGIDTEYDIEFAEAHLPVPHAETEAVAE